MNFEIFKPPLQIQHLVRCFWMLETGDDSFTPPFYQSMADGCAEMIFQYGGGFSDMETSPFYFQAQKSSFRRFMLHERIGMFGVRFYPSAIVDMLKIPAQELSNSRHDIATLFGKRGAILVEQMQHAEGISERIKLITDFLSRFNSRNTSDVMLTIMNLIAKGEGQVNIREIQQRSGYSERHFERLFQSTSGFLPKQFARILRYQFAKRKYVAGQFQTLSALAQASGYSDQSHFIREFKEFSGMYPKEYFNLLNDPKNEEGRVIRGLIIAKDNAHRPGKDIIHNTSGSYQPFSYAE